LKSEDDISIQQKNEEFEGDNAESIEESEVEIIQSVHNSQSCGAEKN
jgi:hypothetical protein